MGSAPSPTFFRRPRRPNNFFEASETAPRAGWVCPLLLMQVPLQYWGRPPQVANNRSRWRQPRWGWSRLQRVAGERAVLHRPPRRSAAVPDGSVRSQSSGMKAALGPVRRVWRVRGGGGPWLRLPVVHASSRVRMSKWSASRSSRVARSSVWWLWCVPTSPSRPSRTARPESS